MSKARPVFPNATVFSTRRVHKRQLLLRPSKLVNQLIRYVVAVLCDRYGLRCHALTALSNHKHDVMTDPDARVVDFQRDCHSIITRYLNSSHGEFESMWSAKPPSRVACVEPSDIIDKIAYTLANPVSSFLVREGRSWPGVRAAWPAKPRIVERPPGFFVDEEDGGSWPATATLTFHRPPGYDQLSDDELAAVIAETTEQAEAKARQQASEAGIQFLGRRAARKQSRYSYPKSREPRFGISPQVAARSKWARIERLEQNRLWLETYEAQLQLFMAGDRDVLFPFGTYKLRVTCGVRCASPP